MQGPGFVLIAFIIASVFTLFFLIKSRHAENMARIEHGMDDDKRSSNTIIFSLGIFLSSIGIGIFSAYLLVRVFDLPDYIMIPGCLFLFGGLGLVLSYFWSKKLED